jgi:phosphate transport system substrate-binding protein
MAVSPVVASLVLVTVAITGAAGVGMIQGSLSSDIAEEASAGDMGMASSTELLIAGSTTVQPVSELLAEAYMDDHQGIKITVQGGGSGAGVSSAGMDIVDIGAASRPVKDKELEKYPDLMTHKIGGSAVVVIAHKDITPFNVTHAELKDAYATNDATKIVNESGSENITKLYQRAEASGTQDTFEDWLDSNGGTTGIDAKTPGATGNAGVLKAVQDTEDSIGFVDFGFAESLDDVVILGIIDHTGKIYGYADIDADHIEDELKNQDNANYVKDLTRPLNYITNGEPTSMEQAFITFAQSPGSTTYFEECGYFAITQFA